MVLVCLPSDALLQHLQTYLGFSYLGCGLSLSGCSSKAQLLLLTLDEDYLLTAAPPESAVAPFGPPRARRSLEVELLLSAAAPDLTWGSSSGPLLCCRSLALSVAAPDLGQGVAPHCHASARSVAASALLHGPSQLAHFCVVRHSQNASTVY